MTLAELADATGIPARTIRFYIARGLLDGPVKAGRGAEYTEEHLAHLQKILQLQMQGRTLAEIANELATAPAPSAPPPTAWWQHVIAGDVTVLVRGDVSPWRMKRIRAAVDEFAARLQETDDDNSKEQ